MADDIRELSTQLAQDPQSLVFLRLGEALRRKGQLDAAVRVATNGLERHPHLADAHDLYARVLTDKHDYERAFDEWDMAVRIAPNHTGALKGLAFLYFKIGDIAQAEAHLEQARKVEPDDPTIDQAIAMVRGGVTPPEVVHGSTVAYLPSVHLPRHRSTRPVSSPVSMAPTKASC
jgi:Flp pilus assembly protein TadD